MSKNNIQVSFWAVKLKHPSEATIPTTLSWMGDGFKVSALVVLHKTTFAVCKPHTRIYNVTQQLSYLLRFFQKTIPPIPRIMMITSATTATEMATYIGVEEFRVVSAVKRITIQLITDLDVLLINMKTVLWDKLCTMLNLLVFLSKMVVASKVVNVSKRENKEFSDNTYISIYTLWYFPCCNH